MQLTLVNQESDRYAPADVTRALSRTLLVAVTTAIAGGFVGALGALLTRNLYVPFLVPVALGVGVGMALGFGAHLVRLRAPAAVVAAGLCGWLVCVGTFHWVEYRKGFVQEVRNWTELEGSLAGTVPMTEERAEMYAEQLLRETVGRGGFTGFLLLRARAGIRLRGWGGAPLSTGWAMLVWGMDLLIALVLTLRVGLGASRRQRST